MSAWGTGVGTYLKGESCMDIYTTQTDYTALLRFALALPAKLYSAKGVLTQTCDLQDAHTEEAFYLFPEEEALLLQDGPRDFSAKYEEGCCIHPEQQNVRKQSPHENTDSYVISTPDGKLSESLHAGIRWYLPESEAVFLSQTQKNQAWNIIIDQRYYETAAGKQLYESLLKMICQKERQGETPV